MTSETRTAPGQEQLIPTLAQLGRILERQAQGDPWPGHTIGATQQEYDAFTGLVEAAVHHNGWFTREEVRAALQAWSQLLRAPSLQAWRDRYPRADAPGRSLVVGCILAGNIPLVGLHDLLSVLMAGHSARVKPSSDDAGLTFGVVQLLAALSPEIAARIERVEGKLGDVDAVIATGSDNTARYFQHYFGHLPHIVRRNRTSVAVLDGSESEDELAAMGEDIFRYHGLGCRSVGKLFLPREFDLDRVFKALFPWKHVVEHGKYANNYDYYKALWLLDGLPLVENGFLLVKEDRTLFSPVGALYIERYADAAELGLRLQEEAARIQCIVGHGHIPFGQAQHPALHEYADGVDTVSFLLELGHSAS